MISVQIHPFVRAAVVALAMFLTFSGLALAAPGDLDLRFGGTGKLVTPNGTAWAVVQPDGKILLASSSLARLRVDRSLDIGQFGRSA
jgi:hypothetical protein